MGKMILPPNYPTAMNEPSNHQEPPHGGSDRRLVRRCVTHHFACDCRENAFREALEAADECLARLEDVGHGVHMDNVTAARKQVLDALELFQQNA